MTVPDKASSVTPMTFPLAFATGFSVASIPGPIMFLIATETLRKGAWAGVLILFAPLLIDAVVMVPLALLLQAALVSGKGAVVLAVVGGGFLVWLGVQSMRVGSGELPVPSQRESETRRQPREIPSFAKGVLTHLTNPYPYLFWGMAGANFILKGFEENGLWGALLFPVGFWFGAGLFNVVIVYVVARGKQLLPQRFEHHLHRFSGLLLIGIGLFVAIRPWWSPF